MVPEAEVIYVVIVQDRHTNTQAHLFREKEVAIQYAHIIADDYDYPEEEAEGNEDVMDATSLEEAGWLFYRALSSEGDCVWVLPRTVG